MNKAIRKLKPEGIWKHFDEINAVPRASKNEKRISDFIKAFGESLGLETQQDQNLNVLIRKPATKGMSGRETVVLQSHLDMVHQKNSNSKFDFDNQGIDMYVDGDWVKARETTLGADNGIGVASIMSILASKDIAHPALEALFTIDEETGMTGAKTLKKGWLKGNIMLNLDTEDDYELTIGCAGGIDVTAQGGYEHVPAFSGKAYQLKVSGLTGGHSGVDIHLGRANANKIMNRVLFALISNTETGVVSIDGGSLRNAIPRESAAVILLSDEAVAKKIIAAEKKKIKAEYKVTDAALDITLKATDQGVESVAHREFIKAFVRAVYACPNGIYRMTPGIAGLVQTSNNISRVILANGSFEVQNLTRSSVDSEKFDLVNAISGALELCGGHVSVAGDYPGWEPKPDAPIIKVMQDIYRKMFKAEPKVDAIHAGLECGIIGAPYPAMQMISFGPNIYGAHSPDERVQISSVQKFWSYLLEILKNIPKK